MHSLQLTIELSGSIREKTNSLFMASTTILLKGTKNPSPIYIRFTEGKRLDFVVKTGLSISPKFWDKKARKIRNVIDVPNRDEINSKLAKLQIAIIDRYNVDFINGVLIDGKWLERAVKNFFNRPVEEIRKTPDHQIYLSDFAKWWLEEKAPKFKVKANKYMDVVTIRQYDQIIKNLIDYEAGRRAKIRLSDTTSDVMDDISLFLTKKLNYTAITAKRKVGRIKFFCERAETEGLEVHKGYKSRIFVEEEDTDYKHPYLNPEEISQIFKLDLSHDKALDNARDNLIIGVWTGLRVSDFLDRLSMDNISGDFIHIKTKKTGHDVAIPLHPMVKSILKKHNGLPPKMPDQKFNARIKIVAQLANIDNEIMGGITTVEKKGEPPRKKVGMYKKYLLVTSHICRRSFATNHFMKVPNKVIMDLAGWKREEMLLNYIKATNMESAIAMKEHWEKQYNI